MGENLWEWFNEENRQWVNTFGAYGYRGEVSSIRNVARADGTIRVEMSTWNDDEGESTLVFHIREDGAYLWGAQTDARHHFAGLAPLRARWAAYHLAQAVQPVPGQVGLISEELWPVALQRAREALGC